MADFDINDPSTYNVSRSDFAGSYYYTVAVMPSDPSKYSGPPFFTISSNSLLSEEDILDRAAAIASNRRKGSYTDMSLDFEITAATINKNLL